MGMRRRRYVAATSPDTSIVRIRPELPPIRRIQLGIARRLKHLLALERKQLRRLPFGLARGIRYRTTVAGPPYRYLGLFEYEISDYVRQFCRLGRRCWDVGGADGYYALLFSKLTGAPVITFEADPDACAALARMCAENPGIGERVEIRQAWVTDASDGNGRVSLDDFATDAQPPDLLKIDVEGAEYDVLRGARRLLVESRPDLVIEVHSQLLEHQCLELLLELGYSPRVVSQRTLLRENRPLAHNRWIVACFPT